MTLAQKLVRWTVRLALVLNIATASLFAQSTVTLAWNANSDPTVTGYNVHYGTASQSYSIAIAAGPATSVTVSNLSPGTTYYFAVGAYGSLGIEGPYSGEISYTVPASRPTPPAIVLTSP